MAFCITDCLSDASLGTSRKAQQQRQISWYDLVPNERNFYSISAEEILELKNAIEGAGRILHNLVVSETPDGKYKILSGHRRYTAVGQLLEEGKEQYEFVPCLVEQFPEEEREIREQFLLIAANSQREKTAWDKLEEVRQMRLLQQQAKERHGLSGRVRDLVAQGLGVSTSRIAKYESILNNLCTDLMLPIKEGNLPLSVAYELSKLSASEQNDCYLRYRVSGKLHSFSFKGTKDPSTDKTLQPNEQEYPADKVFQSNTQQPSTDKALQPSAPPSPTDKVFRSNTQQPPADKAPQPSAPPSPTDKVFRSNTPQLPVDKVFQSNTPQPPADKVFQSNTQERIMALLIEVLQLPTSQAASLASQILHIVHS